MPLQLGANKRETQMNEFFWVNERGDAKVISNEEYTNEEYTCSQHMRRRHLADGVRMQERTISTDNPSYNDPSLL
jgi:hypothetical protein